MSIHIHIRSLLLLILITFGLSFHTNAQGEKDKSHNSNHSLSNIDTQYHPNAIGISKNGLIEGREAIKSYLTDFYKKHGSLVDFQSLYKVPVLQTLEYEIGISQTEKGSQFAHIIIWTKEKDSKQKIADIAYEKTMATRVPAKLKKARKQWIKLCQKKNAKTLVSELYTEDAIYYNRGRILRGHDQLAQEYSYMENTSYTLNLTPQHIEVVAEDIIYEIGMCSGSYNLPYILVWKKEADGEWRIYVDSNY